jgi:pilus assembly protein FimV
MATGFSQASISAIDTDEGVDPVAEADVYMAYGRDAQAEEILLDALKSDPTRTAIHVKLLEIYAGRKNLKQFETLASDLYAQTGGVGSDWEKAAAMGLKLDPANPLYGGAAGGKPAQGADSMVAVPDAGDKTMHDTWTMPGELSQISEAVEKGGAATVILEKPVEVATAAPLPPVLDFDLDLGGPSAATGAAEPPPAAATAASGIDFDLGLDFEPTTQSKPAESDPTATIVLDASAASRAPAVDLPLDIKLDSPEAATSEEALHFDLDLGEPAAPAAGSAPEPVDQEKTLAGAKALDFEFDLGEPAAAPPASQTSPPTLDLAAIDLDLGEAPAAASDAGVEPAADDEVSTKLELAKAYEEMGDKEGARELLNEVIKQGSAEQQAKAQSMLAKLG